MHMFYRVMKGIHQFAANLLSYIPTKYYWNRSTSDLVIAKSKGVNFFWNTVYMSIFYRVRDLTICWSKIYGFSLFLYIRVSFEALAEGVPLGPTTWLFFYEN